MSDKKMERKVSFITAIALHLRAVKLWYCGHIAMLICDLFSAIFTGVSPYVGIWLAARIVDELAGARDPKRLTFLVLATILSTFGISIINLGISRLSTYLYAPMKFYSQKLYADKLLTMDFTCADAPSTRELYARIRQYESMGHTIESAAGKLTAPIASLSGIGGVAALCLGLFTAHVPQDAGVLTILNHPLCLIAVICAMLAITLLSPVFGNKANFYWNKFADQTKQASSIYRHYSYIFPRDISRAADIRIYEQDKITQHYHANNNPWGANKLMKRYARGPITIFDMLSVACAHTFVGGAYLLVCLKSWAGAFGVGDVTQYIGALTSLSGCVSDIIGQFGEMRNSAPFLESIFEFLDLPNTMDSGDRSLPDSHEKYTLELKDVGFCYPGSDRWSLRHVNLTIRPGEKLALVGKNGSGKTTLIKLLCRLYDPTEGAILLNGIDIREYDYQAYLSFFAVVFQDCKLLSLPLGENVAAASDYDTERVQQCLDNAGMSERVSTMPDGINTYLYKDLSDNGVTLSGGEAQKVAIARALYRDAPFVILDEPTAALDPVAEYDIYTRFHAMTGDKSAIFISHRLSSCRFCDRVAVFDQGQLASCGTHDELCADENGLYYALWQAQAQYYNEEKTI